MSARELDARWLGRVPFSEALALQERLAARRRAGEIPDTLLLLEHEPIYTIGRTRDRSSLGAEPLPHPLAEIHRGGQATYHGPGQLIGYPILDLRNYGQDLRLYLRLLEESLISLCAPFGLTAERREGLTGLWVADRKLASIGVGVRHWITQHGFALNVSGELTPFEAITPCGLAGVRMTSMAKEVGNAECCPETLASLYPPILAAGLAAIAWG